MDLAKVMDELGVALDTIEGLRVFPFWADKITPPAAIVAFPEQITYDTAMRRGGDQMEIPVTVLAGRATVRTARDVLARLASTAGAGAVKPAIENHQTTAWDSVRVTRCSEFLGVTVASVEYLGATFYIDIAGKGA